MELFEPTRVANFLDECICVFSRYGKDALPRPSVIRSHHIDALPFGDHFISPMSTNDIRSRDYASICLLFLDLIHKTELFVLDVDCLSSPQLAA